MNWITSVGIGILWCFASRMAYGSWPWEAQKTWYCTQPLWWVRYEDDGGEYKDDGPFPTKKAAEKHAKNWQIPFLILNDNDRAASPV
jgi:hypothetical protein